MVVPVPYGLLVKSRALKHRHTLGRIRAIDMEEPTVRRRHKTMIGDAMMRYLQAQGPWTTLTPALSQRERGV